MPVECSLEVVDPCLIHVALGISLLLNQFLNEGTFHSVHTTHGSTGQTAGLCPIHEFIVIKCHYNNKICSMIWLKLRSMNTCKRIIALVAI